MNSFDGISRMLMGSMLNESAQYRAQGSPLDSSLYNKLKGFKAIDSPVWGNSGHVSGDGKTQSITQIKSTLDLRQHHFNRVDLVKDHHIAVTIKDTIINDCFYSMCDKSLLNIRYRSEDEKLNEKINKDIKELLDNTDFLNILSDCLINEGIDYNEMMLSTKVEYGVGITEVHDDIDITKYIAIYRDLSPVGFVKFHKDSLGEPPDFIDADSISHFMVSPKKFPIEVKLKGKRSEELPEKIRCAKPLLTPVVDLIMQYSALEQLSTAIELNKALSPIIMGFGVSPTSDIDEITRTLRQYTNSLNGTRKAVVENLHSLDVRELFEKMNEIKLIPYSIEEGSNSLNPVKIEYHESDLSEKINNIRKNIALAVGVPESTLASTVVKEKKEDNITSNPRYSRMLSGIQQSLAKGVIDFVYKHLRYKYSNKDGIMLKTINKSYIDARFRTVTNIDNRLDMEQMLVTAETLSSLTGVIDVMAGSPNLPIKTRGDLVLDLWKDKTESDPFLRNIFVIDKALEEGQEYPDDDQDYPENEPQEEEPKEPQEDPIEDIFK
jgi:hypothetical protein